MMDKVNERPVIYQLLPRTFGNMNDACRRWGTLEENGSGKFNDISDRVLEEIKGLGVTHVWFTGVIEHATATDYSAFGIRPDNRHVVKGLAGSPYAIKDYYDVDPDLAVDVKGRMGEFEALVERTHKAGMKVIIDFVPNHTARRYHSDVAPAGVSDFGAHDDTSVYFGAGNNYYYIPRQRFAPSIDLGHGSDEYVEFPAKVTGNDCFTAFPGMNDWWETVKLNYGVDYGDGSRHFVPVPDTWFKMLDILRFWASKGVDAFRCDMAFMVPTEFWQWVIPNVKERFEGVKFIAEIYDVGLYRDFIYKAGFDYLYDKVNLYDTLRGVETSNVSAAALTNCWQTVEGLEGCMLNFLENHDEQRFGSRFYAGDPSKVTPSLVVSSMIGKGAVMIYAGQEVGEQALGSEGFSGDDGRTTIFDYWSMPTVRRWLNGGAADGGGSRECELKLRGLYKRVLNLVNGEKALREGRFFDLMYVNYQNGKFDPHRQYAFLRSYGGETILVAVNFGDDFAETEINIPRHAFDVLAIKEGSVMSRELLTGYVGVRDFCSDKPFKTTIEPHGAVVWKIGG